MGEAVATENKCKPTKIKKKKAMVSEVAKRRQDKETQDGQEQGDIGEGWIFWRWTRELV